MLILFYSLKNKKGAVKMTNYGTVTYKGDEKELDSYDYDDIDRVEAE